VARKQCVSIHKLHETHETHESAESGTTTPEVEMCYVAAGSWNVAIWLHDDNDLA